jgi:hypothetical protein
VDARNRTAAAGGGGGISGESAGHRGPGAGTSPRPQALPTRPGLGGQLCFFFSHVTSFYMSEDLH